MSDEYRTHVQEIVYIDHNRRFAVIYCQTCTRTDFLRVMGFSESVQLSNCMRSGSDWMPPFVPRHGDGSTQVSLWV